MIQYGVSTTQTIYLGYSGLTVTAKVGKGGALASIAGSVTDNSDGSYIVPLAVAETQAPVVTLVCTAPGVSAVSLYLVTEANYTSALATNLGTTNTTVAGWLTSGIALTTGVLSTISGYVSALSIPSAAAIATAVWATIASGTTSALAAIGGMFSLLPASKMAAQSDITALNNLSSAQITTAAQTALTNQGLATSLATALSTFLGAYATTLATQTQATNILTAIGNLTAPANSTIASIWSDVQTILTDVAAAETSSDMATKYTALQTAISGVTTALEGNLDTNIATIISDLGSLATSIGLLPTAGSIEAAVWANMPTALATLLGWTPGQVLSYASGKDPASALTTYGAAKTTDVTGAEGTLASAIAAIPTTGLTSDQMTALENAEAAMVALNAKIAANMPQIIVVAPVGEDGSTLTLIMGDTYDAAGIDGRAISIIVPLAGEPTGLATATFAIVLPGQLSPITIPAPVIDSVGQTATFIFGLTATVTSTLFSGEYNILATFAGGSITSVIHEGVLNVS